MNMEPYVRRSPGQVATAIADILADAGAEMVASLPDGWIAPPIEHLGHDKRFRHIPVNREESAVGLCAGAFFGGRLGVAVAILITGATVSGCVHFEPKPITPEANLTQIEGRTLSNDALAQAVRPTNLFASWPPPSWDLNALTAAALYYNPNLDVARTQWDAARAGVLTAGELPNPTVSAGPGYNADTPPNTITPWILNLNFDFTIETAGKRDYRIARAGRLFEAARFAIATAAWQVRSQLRQALLDLYSGTESAALLERQLGIQESNVTLLERQLAAGEVSSFEVTQARLILDGVRLQRADAERLRREALTRVAAAIGVSVAALDGIALNFRSFEQVPQGIPSLDAQRAALTNRADILTALANYDASQSALQLEIARQYPDIHLGPGYQMDQEASKWTLLLTSALPVLSQNRGPIAEAEARRAAAAATLTATQTRVLGELQRALAAYGAAADKFKTADRMLDDTRALEATARERLAAGDIAQVDLGVVQLEVATRELSRFEALVQVQAAFGAIEDAMQRPGDLPFALPPSDNVAGLAESSQRNPQ